MQPRLALFTLLLALLTPEDLLAQEFYRGKTVRVPVRIVGRRPTIAERGVPGVTLGSCRKHTRAEKQEHQWAPWSGSTVAGKQAFHKQK